VATQPEPAPLPPVPVEPMEPVEAPVIRARYGSVPPAATDRPRRVG